MLGGFQPSPGTSRHAISTDCATSRSRASTTNASRVSASRPGHRVGGYRDRLACLCLRLLAGQNGETIEVKGSALRRFNEGIRCRLGRARYLLDLGFDHEDRNGSP